MPLVLGKHIKVALLRVDGSLPGLDPVLVALDQWRPVKIDRLTCSSKLIPMPPKTIVLGRKKFITLDKLYSIPNFIERYIDDKRS